MGSGGDPYVEDIEQQLAAANAKIERLEGIVGRIRRETTLYEMSSGAFTDAHINQVTRIRRIADEAFAQATNRGVSFK